MAYLPSELKALGGGSGKAPNLFMLSTADTLVDITTANYFKDGIAIFNAGDIIIVNHSFVALDSGSISIIVCAIYARQADGDHTITFSTYSTFAGDVRATDDAGYQSDNFSKIVGGGAPSILFVPYTYRNNTDVTATIVADDYFLEAGLFVNAGDFIYVVANDGIVLLRVLIADITTVTTEQILLP